MNYTIHLDSELKLAEAYNALRQSKVDGSVEFNLTRIANQRTYLQNNAIHKYLSMLSSEFNTAGITIQQALAEAVEREWTMRCAKENIWRPIQIAQYNVKSTTQLERDQVSGVYDTINRHTGEKFGLYVPFPSKELARSAI